MTSYFKYFILVLAIGISIHKPVNAMTLAEAAVLAADSVLELFIGTSTKDIQQSLPSASLVSLKATMTNISPQSIKKDAFTAAGYITGRTVGIVGGGLIGFRTGLALNLEGGVWKATKTAIRSAYDSAVIEGNLYGEIGSCYGKGVSEDSIFEKDEKNGISTFTLKNGTIYELPKGSHNFTLKEKKED